MDPINDTCECEDPRHHPDGECDGETATFRRLPTGRKVALCRECSNEKHTITGDN